jgi:hypothetical protein
MSVNATNGYHVGLVHLGSNDFARLKAEVFSITPISSSKVTFTVENTYMRLPQYTQP